MYLSLKGSLGHTPITDRVGEGPLQIAEGAAAAYSLRNLGSDSPSVVRVRRESDNNERDFTAQDISTSVLTNWVNEQITPPLDLRELTATGRDGPIIEAAAAYSLRNLSDSYTGSVVEVRRSSDDAVRSFTAAEVTDGTLVTWVSEELTVYTQAVDLNVPTGNGSFVTLPSYSIPNIAGTRYRVTFELKHNGSGAGSSSSPRLRGTSSWNVSNVTKSSNLTQLPNRFQVNRSNPEYQTYTVTFTTDAGSSPSPLRFQVYDTNKTYTVRNFTTEILGQDGTVSKWYDQSTTSGVPNAKHAVQTDAGKQPKIVSGGSLVAGGIDFASDFLVASSLSGLTGSLSMLSVSERDLSGNVVSLSNSSNGGRYFAIQEGGSSSTINIRNPTTVNVSSNVSGSTRLTFALTTGATSTSVGANGSAVTTTSNDYGDDFSGTDINQIAIGLLRTVSPTSYFNGRIKEIIIYNTDQTANRTALEANIGEVYGIAGIPAYDDTVNGFVETWYDQSGNGNDATQLTAGSQPKIVNAGALVTGGLDFDGFNDFLDTGYSSGTVSSQSLFTVFKADLVDSTFRTHLDGRETNDDGIGFGIISSVGFRFHVDAADAVTTANTAEELLTGIYGSSSSALYQKGTLVASGSAPSSTSGTSGNYFIGKSPTGGLSLNGKIEEIIIYPSDQTANRPAIEANINNQYDIY